MLSLGRAREPSGGTAAGRIGRPTLLSPIGAIVGVHRNGEIATAKPYRSRLPVLCVGNFTAGGIGKNAAGAAARGPRLRAKGVSPGSCRAATADGFRGPLRSNRAITSAKKSETSRCCSRATRRPSFRATGVKAPLAIEDTAPAECRHHHGRRPAKSGACEGPHRSPSSMPDRGFGNGRVIPAGPLRAPLRSPNRPRGSDRADRPSTAERNATCQHLAPADERSDRQGRDACGRGRRCNFTAERSSPTPASPTLNVSFRLLEKPRRRRSSRQHPFADHHALQRRGGLEPPRDRQSAQGADLVTTEKDLVRLIGGV